MNEIYTHRDLDPLQKAVIFSSNPASENPAGMTEETEGRYLKCDPQTLAVIAAQYIACGDDEEEALRKANAFYLKATAYAEKFALLSPERKGN